MVWRRLRVLLGLQQPVYGILAATSFASAAEAAANVQLQLNASGARAVSLAASAVCCAGLEGVMRVEWNVYVLAWR